LLSTTFGVVKSIQPHDKARFMDKLQRASTFAGRNEVMLDVLYLLEANSAFSGRVLKMEGTAISHAAEDIDVAGLNLFISLLILFLI
jgi:hypothetical protein